MSVSLTVSNSLATTKGEFTLPTGFTYPHIVRNVLNNGRLIIQDRSGASPTVDARLYATATGYTAKTTAGTNNPLYLLDINSGTPPYSAIAGTERIASWTDYSSAYNKNEDYYVVLCQAGGKHYLQPFKLGTTTAERLVYIVDANVNALTSSFAFSYDGSYLFWLLGDVNNTINVYNRSGDTFTLLTALTSSTALRYVSTNHDGSWVCGTWASENANAAPSFTLWRTTDFTSWTADDPADSTSIIAGLYSEISRKWSEAKAKLRYNLFAADNNDYFYLFVKDTIGDFTMFDSTNTLAFFNDYTNPNTIFCKTGYVFYNSGINNSVFRINPYIFLKDKDTLNLVSKTFSLELAASSTFNNQNSIKVRRTYTSPDPSSVSYQENNGNTNYKTPTTADDTPTVNYNTTPQSVTLPYRTTYSYTTWYNKPIDGTSANGYKITYTRTTRTDTVNVTYNDATVTDIDLTYGTTSISTSAYNTEKNLLSLDGKKIVFSSKSYRVETFVDDSKSVIYKRSDNNSVIRTVSFDRRKVINDTITGAFKIINLTNTYAPSLTLYTGADIGKTATIFTKIDEATSATTAQKLQLKVALGASNGGILLRLKTNGGNPRIRTSASGVTPVTYTDLAYTTIGNWEFDVTTAGGGGATAQTGVIIEGVDKRNETTDDKLILDTNPWYIFKKSTITANTDLTLYFDMNALSFDSTSNSDQLMLLEYILWRGQEPVTDINGSKILYLNSAITDSNKLINWSIKTLDLLTITPIPKKPDPLNTITPISTAVTGDASTGWTNTTKISILRRSLLSRSLFQEFTLNDLISWYNPTMSAEYTCDYESGIALRPLYSSSTVSGTPTTQPTYGLQVYIPSGASGTWRTLFKNSGTDNVTYFFRKTNNYKFRILQDYTSTATTASLNTELFSIEAWNEYKINADANIRYVEINSTGETGYNNSIGQFIGAAQKESSSTTNMHISNNGLTGASRSSFLNKYVFDIIQGSQPVWGSVAPTSFTWRGTDTYNYIYHNVTAGNNPGISIADIFYGAVSSSGRDPSTAIIPCSATNQDTSGVYHPDTNNNERILGIGIKYDATKLGTNANNENVWQYTTDGGTTWIRITSITGNSTTNYFLLWTYNISNTCLVKIRYSPLTTQKVSRDAVFDFVVYDASDIVGHTFDTNGNVNGVTTTNVGKWVTLPTTAITSTAREFKLRVRANNTPPTSEIAAVDNIHSLTTDTCQYNSFKTITYNIRDNTVRNVPIKVKNKVVFNYYDFFKAFGYKYPEGSDASLPGVAIERFEPANKMKLRIAYNGVLADISNGRLINEGPFHFVQNSDLAGIPFNKDPTTVATNYSTMLLNNIADPPANTNFVGWFRASDIEGRSGTSIGTWANKITATGTIGDLTQSNGNKPVLVEDSTGLKFVRFNGASLQSMSFGTAITDYMNKTASIFSMIIVERNTLATPSNNFFFGSDNTANNIYAGYNTTSSIRFGITKNNTATTEPSWNAIHNTNVNTSINNNFNIWRFVYTGNATLTNSKRAIYLNGVLIKESKSTDTVANASTFTQYLGRHLTNYYTGDIGEVLFYNTDVTPNLTATENYLFYKWNKPVRLQRFISSTDVYYPLLWYDFSDKSTMVLDSNNNITKIYNKIVSSPYTSNYEATGSVEYIENEINGNSVARFISGKELAILNTSNSFSQYFVDLTTSATENITKAYVIIIVERRNAGGTFMTGNIQLGYRSSDNKVEIKPNTTTSTTLATPSAYPNTDTTQNPVRIWRFHIYLNYSYITSKFINTRIIYLNGVQLASNDSTATTTKGNVIPTSWVPKFAGYSGDLCEVLMFRSVPENITDIENYLKYKWQSPSIIVEPTVNETMNLDISMSLWDQTDTANLNRTYAPVTAKGQGTAYSSNTMKFTVPIRKSNSPPYFDLPSAIDISYAYVIADIGDSNEIEVASLIDTIKTIYTPPKNVYNDPDGVRTTSSGPGDLPGFAIIGVNSSAGTWSASTSSTGGFTNLTGLSPTNVYPISTTIGNKIKHTYSAGFNTNTATSKPSIAYFEIIPWDSTGSQFSEYTYANPSTAESSEESPFGLTTKRIRVYVKTRPYISGSALNTNENLYVYTTDQSKATKTPNTYIARFDKTLPYSQTSVQRLDLVSITADDPSAVQYSADNGTTWLDLPYPLLTPMNGNYPIRINPDKIVKADGTLRNTNIILNLCLYESELDLHSISTVNVTLVVLEENIRPIIELNPSRQLPSYLDSDPTVDSNGNFILTFKSLINDETQNIIFNELFRFVNNPADNTTVTQPFRITDSNNLITSRKRGFVIKTGNKVSGTITYNDQLGISSPLPDGNIPLSYPNKNTNNLRYIPNSTATGVFYIDIYVWDGSQDYTNGSEITAANFNPTTNTTFSEKYVRLQFNVRARNTRPTLTLSTTITSNSMANTIDDVVGASNNGFTIASLMAYMSANGIYDDLDTDPLKGIAITDVSAGVADYGVWEYSTNGGSSWSTLTIGNSGALHFKSVTTTSRIRFRFTKTEQYPDTYSAASLPNFRFVAWDQTNGVADLTYSPVETTADSFSAYSTNLASYIQKINHVNHAPKLESPNPFNISYNVNADISYNIPISTIISTIGDAYKERDINQTGTKGVYLIFYANTNNRSIIYSSTPLTETETSWNEKLGIWKYTTNGTTYNEIPSTGLALLSDGQNAISFQPDVLYKGSTILTLRLNDGLASSDEIFTVTINVNSVNHPPTIVGTTSAFDNVNTYTIIFNNSQTVSVSTLLNEITIRDINNDSPDTAGNVTNKSAYGILLTDVKSLTTASIDSVAELTYKPSQSSATQIFTTTSLETGAIHLSYTGSITYNTAAKLNRSGIGISITFLVWDRTNQAVISSTGYSASPINFTDPRSPYSALTATTPTLTFNTSRRNYAPVVSQSTTPIVLSTVDGVGASDPISTQDLYEKITYTDQNDDAEFGFALLSADISGGNLEYGIFDQVTNQITWTAFTLNTHIILGSNNFIRYVSTRNTTNYADFRLVAWDRTTTETTIPTTRGGETAYSTGSVLFRYNITHVNQRPVLEAGTTSALQSLTYSKTPTIQWTTISTLLKNYSDPDYSLNQRLPNGTNPPQIADKNVGICIIGCDISGVWKWRRGTGSVTYDMGQAVTSSNALLVDSTYQIGFEPTRNVNATYQLRYKIWDKTSGTVENYIDTTTPTADVPYSINNGIFTVDVTRINTAPVLDVSSYLVGTVGGFASDNSSLLEVSTKTIIDTWIGGGIYKDDDKDIWGYDVSYGLALAPTSTYTYQTTNGIFQYKLSSSSAWTNVSTITNQRALPLPYGADVLLRYAPSTNSNGTFTFKVYAWDRSDSATPGQTLNINGNPQASYSSRANDVIINTAYLNHLSTLANTTYSASPASSDATSNAGESWANTLRSLGYNDIDTSDKQGVSIVALNPDPALVGYYQIKSSGGVWTTLNVGQTFLIEDYPIYRYFATQNLTVDQLNAYIQIQSYDGTSVNNSITATITIPVIKVNFAPSINTTLPIEKIRTLRIDNKFAPKGGVDLGISMKTFLDDMGFSDANVGEQRGIAIEKIQLEGVKGYFQYRNPTTGKWIPFPRIPNRQFLFIREKEGALFNRIQFVTTSTVAKKIGTASILFYGWDVSENYDTGSLRQVSLPSSSFSNNRGTYKIQIAPVPIVKK